MWNTWNTFLRIHVELLMSQRLKGSNLKESFEQCPVVMCINYLWSFWFPRQTPSPSSVASATTSRSKYSTRSSTRLNTLASNSLANARAGEYFFLTWESLLVTQRVIICKVQLCEALWAVELESYRRIHSQHQIHDLQSWKAPFRNIFSSSARSF